MQTFFIWFVIFLFVALFGVWQIGEVKLSMPAVETPTMSLPSFDNIPWQALSIPVAGVVAMLIRARMGRK